MKRQYKSPRCEALLIATEQPLTVSVNNRKGSGEQLSRGSYLSDEENLLILSILL